MTTYTLDTVCKILKISPQTVWNTLLKKSHSNWNATKNPHIEYNAVALAYGLSESKFRQCVLGKDKLLNDNDLTTLFSIPLSVVKERRYPAAIRRGSCIRYLRSEVMQRHADKYSDRKSNKKKK